MSRSRSRSSRPSRATATAPARPRATRSPLERAWPLVLVALFAVALAWRLAYLSRLAGTPLFGHLRADEIGYWNWASNLLAGKPGTDGPFFFGPLYPHLLALVRAVVGSDILAVLRVQAVWGALAVVLLADAARRASGAGAALVVGVALAFHAMATFFDGLVLMESPLFALEALLVWLWARAGAGAARGWWPALTGLVVGLIDPAAPSRTPRPARSRSPRWAATGSRVRRAARGLRWLAGALSPASHVVRPRRARSGRRRR